MSMMSISIMVGLDGSSIDGGSDIGSTTTWWDTPMTDYWGDSISIILPAGRNLWETTMDSGV